LEVIYQLHVPVALTSEKKPVVPNEKEVGWAPEPVWTCGEQKNLDPYRDSNFNP
jgi:hypothetical protein